MLLDRKITTIMKGIDPELRVVFAPHQDRLISSLGHGNSLWVRSVEMVREYDILTPFADFSLLTDSMGPEYAEIEILDVQKHSLYKDLLKICSMNTEQALLEITKGYQYEDNKLSLGKVKISNNVPILMHYLRKKVASRIIKGVPYKKPRFPLFQGPTPIAEDEEQNAPKAKETL